MEREHDIDLCFPWNRTQLLTFITVCSMDGLKFATVQSYLSTVRRAHRLGGFELDTPWEANMLLNSLKKSVHVRDKRVAVTPRILLTLKHRIKQSGLSQYNKLMLWAISTMMFFGCLRVGEVLSPSTREFADTTLIWERVSWNDIGEDPSSSWMKLSLLAPKEKRCYSLVDVEILGLSEKTFFPIRAFRAWRRLADKGLPAEPSMPVFRFIEGTLVTPRWLNDQLKSLLQSDVDYSTSGVFTHSFRAGMVTTLARMGFSERTCQLVGRWTSSAWMAYAKQGRSLRMEDMRKISSAVLSAVSLHEQPAVLVNEVDCRVPW